MQANGKPSISVFAEIKHGLNEAIEYENGTLDAITRTVSVTSTEYKVKAEGNRKE